jgi:2-oxoglutarate ferredoxin oxidoreductase subunit beta
MNPTFEFKTSETPLTVKDYRTDVAAFWCAGCGYHGILNGLFRALASLNIAPSDLINISGIGCSSRTPYFVESYKMHTLHGRAGPVATGVQLARPDLPLIITGGDGDGFSIGGGHMPHLARKNVNLTYILMDNHIYGLTKGQVSPTSRSEMIAYTTPYGGVEEPLNPLKYMLAYGASFVAQTYAAKPAEIAELIEAGVRHKGFAFINILSNCPSFNKIDTPQQIKAIMRDVPKDHDVSCIEAATSLVNQFEEEGAAPNGLLYQSARPTLDEQMARLVAETGGHADYDIRQIIDLAKP